ncbi:MAG: relaxase domain-containing protein [Rhodospirillales bacterium]|nr:relaxase domain-containing protein [Rhodospirillales bacterium]
MVATLAQAASAAYYLESQRSFRHPNEYYTAGEEPDGVWFNPTGLFGLEDGGKVDSADFHRLYHGFAPDGSGKLTRNAGSEKRSPGLDMTFSADKSVSALWAIADPELRVGIEQAHNDAARVALEETVFRHCAWTRIRNGEGHIEVLPADVAVAMFQHGTSRDNDPQLHTHCMIFNAARTHEDGKWRAMHQHPVYGWVKAAGAVYRNRLAWNIQRQLGLPMQQYGRDGEFSRIGGVPEDLAAHWSKRRAAIVDAANDMGFKVEGNAARAAAANKITRAGKSPDNDPEVRHRRWRGEAEGFCEREALIAELVGKAEDITHEQVRDLTAVLETLPERLTRDEAVFRLPDIVERVSNATAGLLGREAVATAVERVMRHPEVVRLTRIPRSAEGRADMAHTRLYTTGRTLVMEQALRDMATGMAAETGHGLPAQAIEEKIAALLEQGYPLSEEQSLAIRHATAQGGRVAVIEGAAGSGKTTTLRPIADLCREHGGTVIATAVAWRTAVALGNDLDARPFCVDKLLKLAAKNGIEIDTSTTIVVDEAGMLSTRQAHHILRLAERHGARVVFAGDTRQQQPVEAGPGLRLIRDAVGSVRVDRIRRQKPDLEDILAHVHGETPAAARFRGGLMDDDERARIVADYEAMADRPAFMPWQVNVSEALRDGNAASAIEAWHERGRLHLGYNEERTLTALVDEWHRYTRQHPEKSAAVLARTRAEVRALSHLMRERRFARHGEADGHEIERVTVTVSRGTEDDRTASPLEIAVGDRLRIGATCWEKQLFNGTVVTVEDLDVLHGERKPAGRMAGTEARDREPGEDQPSVLITARTGDGRRVTFRHEEIRDWYGNIRLDHGYALTIAAAQGLTVDRTFLLADDRPARETIYPAATRHREEIDVYVNRAPLALDVADRWADSDREAPVSDAEIRTYLADRWSRSVPKEAALDYMGVGDWEDRRDDIHRRAGGDLRHDEAAEARAAANDDAMTRIARDVQRTAFVWRHGAAVDAFATGRQEVVAAWDELRERSRAEGDAVALGDAYRETLDRHAALLQEAEPFRARPQAFAPLLAERARIGRGDLEEFEALHERARKHRRAATMRQVHRTRRETESRVSRAETQEDARPAHERAVEAASLVPPEYLDSVPPPTDEDHAEARAAAAWEARRNMAPPPEPREPGWLSAWGPLVRDWTALIERARRSGTIAFYTAGYAEVMARMQELAETPGIPSDKRAQVVRVLENRDRHVAARKRVDQFLDAAHRHRNRRCALEEAADEAGVAVTQTADYDRSRGRADRLIEEGQAILDGGSAFGPHLDNIPAARELAEKALSGLGEAIRKDDAELAEARREAYLRGQLTRALARLRFAPVSAPDIGAGPSPPGPGDDGTLARRALWRLRRVHDWDGRLAESERQTAIAAGTRTSLARWESLKERWDRQLDRAEKEGVHVIYTGGYGTLRREMSSAARDDPYLAEGARSEIDRVIGLLDTPEAIRKHVEKHRDAVLAWLERRDDMLGYVSAWDTRPPPDARRYDAWRDGVDRAVAEAEIEFANRAVYGIHLDGLKHRGKGVGSALSRVREVLAEDDRHMAEALVPERKGDDPRRREERIAGLLDDPEKLREMHRRQIERREARKVARRRRKGRHQVRSMRM